MRSIFLAALGAAVLVGLAPVAHATKPLLDCEAGTVDKVLCDHTELMALHQRVIATVNQALTKAEQAEQTDTMADTIDATQEKIIGEHSGWLASRANCLDVVASTPRDCLIQMYSTRAAELVAEWQLLPPTHNEIYLCNATTVMVTHFPTDHPVITLEYDDNRAVFKAVPAASGLKFEGPFGQFWWQKGPERMFLKDLDKEPIDCVNAEGMRPLGTAPLNGTRP